MAQPTTEWENQWRRVQADAQTHTHYLLRSRLFPRIPFDTKGDSCPDCGVAGGKLHVVGNTVTGNSPPVGYPLCSGEICPNCRGQALSCPCQLAPGKRPGAV
jgi:hypothetical protein